MFTIGADPEIFVRKGGKAVSAHGLVNGTKSSPLKTEYGAVQVDGMALEFNIDPTDQHDFEAFNRNIVRTMDELKKMTNGYSFNISPVQEFDPAYMEAQPDEAKMLGCDPDFNAYTLEPNPTPDGERAFRTGAGHVHIGWGADIPVDNEEHLAICANFVKMLDATVGLFMTVIDRDPRRRDLYGKAGAFRPKSYGVEYRTPSNEWIKSRDTRVLFHGLVNTAITRMTKGFTPNQVAGVEQAEIIRIINSGDHETALRLIRAHNILGRFTTHNAVFDRVITKLNAPAQGKAA